CPHRGSDLGPSTYKPQLSPPRHEGPISELVFAKDEETFGVNPPIASGPDTSHALLLELLHSPPIPRGLTRLPLEVFINYAPPQMKETASKQERIIVKERRAT
ncbi:jg542, partial [Pararge aegeria aegeria]